MTAKDSRRKSIWANTMDKDTQYADIIHDIDRAAGHGDYHILFYGQIQQASAEMLLEAGFKLTNVLSDPTDPATKISW